MEKFEYKVVTYDTKGFWGGNVEVHQIENQYNQLGNEMIKNLDIEMFRSI